MGQDLHLVCIAASYSSPKAPPNASCAPKCFLGLKLNFFWFMLDFGLCQKQPRIGGGLAAKVWVPLITAATCSLHLSCKIH